MSLAIPKLRQGSYFPDWLLERRRRAEAALVTVVATSYLLGVSTRRMEKLVETLGITRLSKSQVSEMAKDLDAQVEAFWTRPLDAGPYTFAAAGALVLKVREGGRIVNVHALLATGVNADGYREILGLHVTTSEDGAGWLAFFRDLTARGLAGVALVTSDAHRGLTEAIGATLPGAAWQRCRTHYAANLMSVTPKSAWGWVRALLHSVYDQPDAASVHAQFGRVLDALAEKLPAVAAHLDAARADILAFTAFPQAIWRQIWSNNPRNGSTGRSAAAPMWPASSPAATPSSAWLARSSPSSTTNGSRCAATSAWTSWPRAGSPAPQRTQPRRLRSPLLPPKVPAENHAATSSHTTPLDVTPNRSGQAEPQCIQEWVSVNLALSRIANLSSPGTWATDEFRYLGDMIVRRRCRWRSSCGGGVPWGWRRRRVLSSGRGGWGGCG